MIFGKLFIYFRKKDTFEKTRMKKISVISGGTSGLGLEIANLLTLSGKNVLILGRNSEKMAAAMKTGKSLG